MSHDRKMVTGLVEADVSVMSDTEKLDIYAAPILDPALIVFTQQEYLPLNRQEQWCSRV